MRICIRPLHGVFVLLAIMDIRAHPISSRHSYRQIEMLKNARSITARLLTTSESAASHCQVGNYGLAFRTIVNWLDGMQGPDTVRPPTGVATARLRNA